MGVHGDGAVPAQAGQGRRRSWRACATTCRSCARRASRPIARTSILRARDGTLVEIFEWVSQAAIDAAHTQSAKSASCGRAMRACCDYVTLADLPEAREMFPGFELVTP